MKKIAIAMLLLGALQTAKAENWVHILRYDDPKIAPVDPAPYDEYLNTDFVDFDGKWTLIRTKIVSDEADNDFHGKLEIWTWAISCREFKQGRKEYRQFDDVDGKQEKLHTVSSAAELDRFARSIAGGPIPLAADSPAAALYRYACLGVTPHLWAEMIKSRSQEPMLPSFNQD
ncbi:hypothetical protein [Paraherbaspirillum soli]|uniref:Uncharacterized protein n=1 Tax=Paraherbaspirillum soli TaxID=631222 RepID=A0ABW0MDR5_9BURK